MGVQVSEHEFLPATRSAAVLSRPWVVAIARAGYAARGLVYLLVGGLALLSASGRHGGTSDQKDAFESLLSAPAGAVLLAVLAGGLICFAIWRSIQAVLDTDGHGNEAKGWIIRAGFLCGAITQVAMAIAALKIESGEMSHEDGTRHWSAWLLNEPFGRWMLALVAAGIFGAGVAHAVRAIRRTYEKWFAMSPATMKKLHWLFQFGLLARGFVFCTIGSFILYAAWTYDHTRAGGLADVFDKVRGQPFGAMMLALLAGGLFAFGLYGLAQAWWRRVDG